MRGGFAEVNPQGLTVLAEVAMPSPNSMPAVAQQIKDAEEDVADAKTTRRAGARRKISII